MIFMCYSALCKTNQTEDLCCIALISVGVDRVDIAIYIITIVFEFSLRTIDESIRKYPNVEEFK